MWIQVIGLEMTLLNPYWGEEYVQPAHLGFLRRYIWHFSVGTFSTSLSQLWGRAWEWIPDRSCYNLWYMASPDLSPDTYVTSGWNLPRHLIKTLQDCKVGDQVVSLALPHACPGIISNSIELVSSAARVTSVKSQKPLWHSPGPKDWNPGTSCTHRYQRFESRYIWLDPCTHRYQERSARQQKHSSGASSTRYSDLSLATSILIVEDQTSLLPSQ